MVELHWLELNLKNHPCVIQKKVWPICLNWDFLPSVVNRAHVLFPSQFRSEVGGHWRETERKTQRDTILSVHIRYKGGGTCFVSARNRRR
jgi:hypothetical protein